MKPDIVPIYQQRAAKTPGETTVGNLDDFFVAETGHNSHHKEYGSFLKLGIRDIFTFVKKMCTYVIFQS